MGLYSYQMHTCISSIHAQEINDAQYDVMTCLREAYRKASNTRRTSNSRPSQIGAGGMNVLKLIGSGPLISAGSARDILFI